MRLRTHCKAGHLYDETNTYVKANGARECRICKRDRARRYRGSDPSRYREDRVPAEPFGVAVVDARARGYVSIYSLAKEINMTPGELRRRLGLSKTRANKTMDYDLAMWLANRLNLYPYDVGL